MITMQNQKDDLIRNTLVNRVYTVTAKVEAGDKHIEESRTEYKMTSEG